MGASIADDGRTTRPRAEAEVAVARSRRDPAEVIPGEAVLSVGSPVLPEALSPGLFERCEYWRAQMRREARRSRERDAMLHAGHRPDAPVTPEVAAELAREDAEADARWYRIRAEICEYLSQQGSLRAR
jgi:hypothetical protein